MSNQEPNIVTVPLGRETLPFVKVLVYQFNSCFSKDKDKSDWENREGLYYPKNINKFSEIIRTALAKAAEEKVNLIVFPELSVPEEIVDEITEWSKENETIIIAGSHYKKINDSKKPFNVCPVIFNGDVYSIMKRDASKFEDGKIESATSFHVFINTPIGNFSVIICSDYLSKLPHNFKGIAEQTELDFCIVPAFQPKAEEHLTLMSGDIRNPVERYFIYCNHKNEFANGNSALFGVLHNDEISEFKQKEFTDYSPLYKAVSPTSENWDYFIAKLKTSNKRNPVPTFIGDKKNIDEVEFGSLQSISDNETRKIIQETSKPEIKYDRIKSERDEHDFLELSDEDFKILPKETYQSIVKKMEVLSEKPDDFKDKEFINGKLVADIKKSLDEKGIAFITAPIRFGKSHLLKYLKTEFADYSFITEISGASLIVKKDETKFLTSLYYIWFKSVAESVLHEMGISKQSLSLSHITHKLIHGRIESEPKFKEWLQSNIPTEESSIQGLVKCLSEFKKDIEFNKEILVSFHFDDVQEYISYPLFEKLRDDLVRFNNSINDGNQLTVKLIVASRYLPSLSVRKFALKILPYFDNNSISNLVEFLNDEMKENIKFKLSTFIYEQTDGYPWFVIRFLKLYLRVRLNDDKSHPLKLANSIFNNENYWTMNLIFDEDNESEYLEELNKLISKSSPSMKTSLKRFLQLEGKQISLNNGWTSENEFLIRQSGFIRIQYESGLKLPGCILLRKHFQNIIETYLL